MLKVLGFLTVVFSMSAAQTISPEDVKHCELKWAAAKKACSKAENDARTKALFDSAGTEWNLRA